MRLRASLEIRIAGNQAFPKHAEGLFDLNDGGWFNWYSKADRYSRAKLNADLETLRAYYLNRGYLEFAVESTQVAISPDKQDITVTINVKESQPYTVVGVQLEGEYLGKEDEFKSLVTIRPGEPYRAEAVADTTKAFVEKFGTFGYAFAKVDALPQIDRANAQVTLCSARTRSAGLRAPHQRRRNTRPATMSCDASFASSSRAGMTAPASSCRATGSTASASSAKSRSTATRYPARSTRST